MITKLLLGRPLFKTGLVFQAISALLVITLVVSIKAGWIELPAPNPDQPTTALTPLDSVFLVAMGCFAIGFTLQIIAVAKLPKPQK